jgi:hypothetical protein
MATYYKYQNPSEIGAAPTLDWGTVISNVNQNLQNQEKQRYENREVDKKLTNDILTKANEVSLTSDPNLNALITNMGYDTKRNVFELQKKLESGQISRSDFTIANQNTSASIGQLNQFTKTYGADYDKYLKDVQEGKTSAYADFMQKWKGGFQNFKDKKLIHNPNDGRLYVAELDDKGKVKEGPLGMVPMSTLVEVKNFNDQKIDVLAETNRYAKQFEPFVELVRKGGVETRQQIENYPGFKDLVNNITEAIAKNEKGYASILTDTDGTYSITGDGASSGKNIGLKNNGAGEMVPIIDEAMKTRARDIVKEYIIAQTGIKETGMERFAPQRALAGGGGRGKKEVVTTTNDLSLASGKTIPGSGKYTGVSNFTIKQTAPVVDMSTGLKRKLKNIYFDNENPNNIRMVVQIQDKDDPTKTKDVSYSSFKRTEKIQSTRPGGKPRYVEQDPDLAELNNFATKIYSPELDRYLEDWTELIPILQQRGQSVKKTATSSKTKTKTVINRSQLAAKAAAAGYSAAEYEKLLKQKGVKIQ